MELRIAVGKQMMNQQRTPTPKTPAQVTYTAEAMHIHYDQGDAAAISKVMPTVNVNASTVDSTHSSANTVDIDMSSHDGERYSDIPVTPRDENEMKDPVLETAYRSDSTLKAIVIPNVSVPNSVQLEPGDEDVVTPRSWRTSELYGDQRGDDVGPRGHVLDKSRWRSEGHLKGIDDDPQKKKPEGVYVH